MEMLRIGFYSAWEGYGTYFLSRHNWKNRAEVKIGVHFDLEKSFNKITIFSGIKVELILTAV